MLDHNKNIDYTDCRIEYNYQPLLAQSDYARQGFSKTSSRPMGQEKTIVWLGLVFFLNNTDHMRKSDCLHNLLRIIKPAITR